MSRRSNNRLPRHQPTKAELAERLVAAHRQRANAAELRGMEMIHLQNLDAIATGQAEVQCLWDWAAGVLMYSHVADAMQAGQAEMQSQLELATRLAQRWARTGRVLFTGPDYQAARDGVAVMTQLAALADFRTLHRAATWGLQAVALLSGAHQPATPTPAAMPPMPTPQRQAA